MKITGDYTLEFNKRRRIIFRIEESDSVSDIAVKLSAVFKESVIVLYKSREIRLPVSVCKDKEKLSGAIADVNPDRIEIGEGRGNCEKFYEISVTDNDLICSGPAEYDFYAEIIASGLSFGI